MKRYVKEIDGVMVYKTKSQISIVKDDMTTYNPTEEMILADGWVEYVQTVPVPKKTIESVRKSKISEIEKYDESSAVNEFFIQRVSVWLDKVTRVGLRLRFETELKLEKEFTNLWYNNSKFTLPVIDATHMLYLIEEYASICYDNTQLHIANVSKLETIEEIESYDYTVGYPNKLYF